MPPIALKPRTFVRLFQPRFADAVRDGAKTCTIRLAPKRRPAVGDMISLRAWSGLPYRSPQRILGRGEITRVCAVQISELGRIVTTENGAAHYQSEAFARADGFASLDEMLTWFDTTHGLPFQGILIEWRLV